MSAQPELPVRQPGQRGAAVTVFGLGGEGTIYYRELWGGSERAIPPS